MAKVRGGRVKQGFLRKISPEMKTFLIFAIVCLLIKLALTSWRAIYAIPNALSDDGLMQNTTISILNLHWLGAFDAFTLSKRNIFPFYLGLVNTLGIPLLVANEILYFVAVLVIVFLLKKYTNKKWLPYVVFGVLFFNPATFATAVSVRIYRDAIYPSIIMICLGSLFHVLTNAKNQKGFKGWFVAFVISLTTFWFLREESAWILPIVVCCLAIIAFFVAKSKEIIHKKRVILELFLAPILAILMVGLGFRVINFATYGEFVVTEDQMSSYQEFYKAIGKVSSDERTDTIDFPTDVRKKVYSVSPTFATLEERIENTIFPTIKLLGDNTEEINSGWTGWAIRQAMDIEGYYDDAKTADDFYKQVALEINTACDEGRIECNNHKPGLTETILGNIPRLTGETFNNLQFVYSFSDTEVKQYYSDTEPLALGEASEIITGGNIMSQSVGVQENLGDPTHYTRMDKIKIKILAGIRKIYVLLSPLLFWVAVVLFVVLSIWYLFIVRDGRKFYQRPQFDLIVFATSALVALLIRCLIVAYLNISAFYATSSLYLYTGYSLMLVFEMCVLVLTVLVARDIIRKKVRKNEGKKK